MSSSAIYAIVHLGTGRVYVGSALNLRTRWKCHKNKLARGSHENTYLQRSWKKYGADDFAFTVLEEIVDPNDLVSAEQRWINVLRAAERHTGFNICPKAGSTLGRKYTPEQRAALSAKRKAANRKTSEETKRLIAAKAMGNRRGIKNLSAPWKLDEQKVIGIFNAVAQGVPVVQAAKRAGVSRETANRVLQRVIWAHVPIPQDTLDAIKALGHRRPMGAANPKAKFTEEQVAEIKERLITGHGNSALAREFGVNVTTIESIKYGKHWAHVKPRESTSRLPEVSIIQ